MYKLWRILMLCGLAFMSQSVAMAGQSAELVCVETDWEFCRIYELQVTVTSDGDVGRPGAFAIGAQLSDKTVGYWTQSGGWRGFDGGMWAPADGYYPALPSSRLYVVYRGQSADMCILSSGRYFKLYAGHGALTPEQDQKAVRMSKPATVPSGVSGIPTDLAKKEEMRSRMTQKYASSSGVPVGQMPRAVSSSASGTVSADHIRRMFIQNDAVEGGKGGLVYSKDCFF